MAAFQYLSDLDPNESDPIILWSEIHILRDHLKGPDGFDTWQQAAVSEKVKRIALEKKLKELQDENQKPS